MSNMKFTAPFYVVSGPSGSGKTTICRRIADEFGWYYSVSHTTRALREGEKEGVDYFFVNAAKFQDMIQKGEFLEWARVYDNYYGTSRQNIEERLKCGQGVILDVDTQGAAQIKKLMLKAILVFIKTVELDDLKARLKTRGQDDDGEIAKRMKNAQSELSHIGEYDHVIVNDDIKNSVQKFKLIIGST